MVFKESLIASLLATTVLAQSYSSCDPLKGCLSENKGAQALTETSFAGQKKLPAGWKKQQSAGNLEFGPDGVAIVLAQKGDSPHIESEEYILFGSAEVKVKVAPGQGVISDLVLMSDTRDEMDWEWTGANGQNSQSNYFGKGGDGTYDRGGNHPTPDIFNAWHTYKIEWTPDYMAWSIDGKVVRRVNKEQVKSGGGYPQTPMKISLGLWSGGESDSPGTVEWAGGKTDYATPHKMWVSDVKIVNYSPATSYKYTDNSGSTGSIKINGGALLSNKVSTPVPDVPPPPPVSAPPAGAQTAKPDASSGPPPPPPPPPSPPSLPPPPPPSPPASNPSAAPPAGPAKPSSGSSASPAGPTSPASTPKSAPNATSTNPVKQAANAAESSLQLTSVVAMPAILGLMIILAI